MENSIPKQPYSKKQLFIFFSLILFLFIVSTINTCYKAWEFYKDHKRHQDNSYHLGLLRDVSQQFKDHPYEIIETLDSLDGNEKFLILL